MTNDGQPSSILEHDISAVTLKDVLKAIPTIGQVDISRITAEMYSSVGVTFLTASAAEVLSDLVRTGDLPQMKASVGAADIFCDFATVATNRNLDPASDGAQLYDDSTPTTRMAFPTRQL